MNSRERALRIGVGTIAAQLISATGLILIPNFYSPSEFGVYILILGIATLLQPFATLKIEILSTVVKSQEDSDLLFWFVKKLTIFVSGTTFIFSFVYSSLTSSKTTLESFGFSFAVSIIVLVQSICIVLVQERLRSDHLKDVALSGVLQNGVTLVSQIILSKTKVGGMSLILGYVLGRTASILKLRKSRFQNQLKNYALSDINRYNLPYLLKPILKVFPTAILDASTLAIPILFIGNSFGNESAGIMGLLQSALLVPVTLISSMIYSTLYSQTATVRELGFIKMLEKFHKEIGRQISKVIFVFFIISIIATGFILPFVLNERWQLDIRVILVVSAAYSLQLLTLPTIGILNVLEKFDIPRNLSVFKSGSAILICILSAIIQDNWIEFAITFYSIQFLIHLCFMGFVRVKSNII
jgi:O-antigen/teichoic acid export membrane protein